MKKLTCTFYRPEKVRIDEFQEIVEKLEKDLDTLCNDRIAAPDVYEYVYRLSESARVLKGKEEVRFLGLDEPANMPGDARVDFFYRPTYLGAAIMIRSVLLHPELLGSEDRYGAAVQKALPGLLLACTGRGFLGHGYDRLRGLIETLTVFTKAGAAEFIQKYPELCHEFSDLYIQSMKMLEEKVEDHTVRNEWGDDYTKEALALLKDCRHRVSAWL